MENRSLLNIPEEAKSHEFKEMERKLFTEEKTAPATGEILINEAEFDAAKDKVVDDMMNDPKLEGMAKLLIPMTGITFAAKMKEILFHENKEG